MIDFIRCDGCEQDTPTAAIAFVAEGGHVVRYCSDCAQEWKAFETAQQAEAARVQRLLDLWVEQRRHHLPLKLTPLDLPPVARGRGGRQIILD